NNRVKDLRPLDGAIIKNRKYKIQIKRKKDVELKRGKDNEGGKIGYKITWQDYSTLADKDKNNYFAYFEDFSKDEEVQNKFKDEFEENLTFKFLIIPID
ncbi:MAG: hypothetical protein ACR2NY_05570, partial [Alphaproteobacteria bacterium]